MYYIYGRSQCSQCVSLPYLSCYQTESCIMKNKFVASLTSCHSTPFQCYRKPLAILHFFKRWLLLHYSIHLSCKPVRYFLCFMIVLHAVWIAGFFSINLDSDQHCENQQKTAYGSVPFSQEQESEATAGMGSFILGSWRCPDIFQSSAACCIWSCDYYCFRFMFLADKKNLMWYFADVADPAQGPTYCAFWDYFMLTIWSFSCDYFMKTL